MTTVISKSKKNRRPASYLFNGRKGREKEIDKSAYPRAWKQIVVIEPTGRKRVNGKPEMTSFTFHVPA